MEEIFLAMRKLCVEGSNLLSFLLEGSYKKRQTRSFDKKSQTQSHEYLQSWLPMLKKPPDETSSRHSLSEHISTKLASDAPCWQTARHRDRHLPI
eukprot:g68715.t1